MQIMSRKLTKASAISVAATLLIILFSATGSGAAEQNPIFVPGHSDPANLLAPQAPVASPVTTQNAAPLGDEASGNSIPASPASLADLVAQQSVTDDLSQELHCLAGAIYFEARNEKLEGQLAVGRVVVARAKSGRFPNSYCGVVYQRSQFSFIRGAAMPSVNRQSRSWHNAVAIAEIAHSGSWQSPVEGALFFHAKRVSPNWRLHRVAQIENHIFYR